MKNILVIIAIAFCNSCKTPVQLPNTTGALQSSYDFGYQALDPLDAQILFRELDCDELKPNQKILNALPDETMRMAIINRNNNLEISALGNSISVENNNYTVIIDYVKTDTKAFSFNIKKEQNSLSIIEDSLISSRSEIKTFPIYVGIGVRLRADLHTSKAGINLSNLFSIGAAAKAGSLRGTLSLQTLGITGPSISPNIPIPTEISNGSISNAILAIGAIKAKIYEESTIVKPRIVGFYNTVEKVDIMNQLIIAFLGNTTKVMEYAEKHNEIITTF